MNYLYDDKKNEYTSIKIGDWLLGDGHFQIIAGPCSIESEEQILILAKKLKSLGCNILRGGAFKPRTSPYDFQGLGARGLEYLVNAKRQTGLAIVSEIVDASMLDLFEDVDIIQVGARNMQNYELLKKLGQTQKPIILKRGFVNTINEFLLSAEYLLNAGNPNIILCERGIRTFETQMRNTLDLSCVALLKSKTQLPVIVDPSHATGLASLVTPMSFAAAAAGADGLMVEVHENPNAALTDKEQALSIDQFSELSSGVKNILPLAFRHTRN